MSNFDVHLFTRQEKFRQLVRSKVAETREVCVGKWVEMALGRASLNLIVVGELIRFGFGLRNKIGR